MVASGSVSQEQEMRAYEGPLPSFLYRFRPVHEQHLDRLAFEIRDCGIFLSAISDFNDPEEGRPDVRFLGPRSEVVSLLQQICQTEHPTATQEQSAQFAENVYADLQTRGFSLPDLIAEQYYERAAHITRVACFSESPFNPVMWSHYASYTDNTGKRSHYGGICLQYAIDDSWRPMLRPVTYAEHRPTVNRLKLGDVADPLFVKGKSWASECEWRIVRFFGAKHVDHPTLNDYAKLLVDPFHLTGVIFGLKTPQSFKETCWHWVQGRSERPRFYQTFRQHFGLALDIVPTDVLGGDRAVS